jgi:hypothetical protein
LPDLTSSMSSKFIREVKTYLKTGFSRQRSPEVPYAASTQQRAIEREEKSRNVTTAKSPPVFFIVGHGKSGTTWLKTLLNAHPEVLCKGEGRFFNREWHREDLRDIEAKVPPRTLYGALSSSQDLTLWMQRSVWGRGEDTEQLLAGLTRAATDYFLQRELAKSGKRIVGDKTPFLVGSNVLEEIKEIYPEAKVIHIIRDGRDVEVSWMHHRWNRSADRGGVQILNPTEKERRDAYFSDTQRHAEMSWFDEDEFRRTARLWSSQVDGAVREGPELLDENYTEVRYETLLHDTEAQARRLLDFIGADSDEKTVRRCIRRSSFRKLSKGRRRGEEDPTSFFRKGVAGDWKNVFTEKDKQIFKEETGDLLVQLGYEESNDW